MNFWKKSSEVINSIEYEKLFRRIIELSARTEELHNKISILQTNYDNLRGNFNKKLSSIKKEEEIKEIDTFNNNSDVPFG